MTVSLRTSALGLLLALGLAFGAGVLVGRQLHPSAAALTARADSLDRAATALDSLLAARARTDSVRLAEASRRTLAARLRAVSLGDTATRLAQQPIPLAPETCAVQLAALRSVVLGLVPAYDSALAAAAAELTLWQATVAARDTAIGALQGQRDTARALVRQALAIARPWPTWRKVLSGVSCAATGLFAARKAATPAVLAGVGCVASLAL